jgi:hypothetical protein
MLTMAILAMIGAFTFGFVLCGMCAVGAAADRSGPDHGHDSLEDGDHEGATAARGG